MAGQYDQMVADHEQAQENYNRADELRAAAIVLATVKRNNGDENLADNQTYRDTISGFAKQGDVVPVLIDLAEGVAASFQHHIDAGTITVEDVRTLIRESISKPTDDSAVTAGAASRPTPASIGRRVRQQA